MDIKALKTIIEKAWENRSMLSNAETQAAIRAVIAKLDAGEIRVAEYSHASWKVNIWIKKAVILYFPISEMQEIHNGPFEYFDKIPLKHHFKEKGIRVVPQALARYGSYLEPGVILMPSYVNIGAYIGSGSMIDTWATVGSCAQIGQDVHISGGVGIGGVLEPVQAAPVIIEDHCFIGSRCILVEGVKIGREAVLAANVSITQSTKIIDVSGDKPIYYKGEVPPQSVVIPGSYEKDYPAGKFQVSAALIIGKRKPSTNKKTSLNEALRTFEISI